MSRAHEHYELLNLIGYGLAKFEDFTQVFGFSTKTEFYQHCVAIGVGETRGVIKNRQDLFDHFFENGRRGWWQKGDAYIHRKLKIDSLFGDEDVRGYVRIVQEYLQAQFKVEYEGPALSPLVATKFRKLQETGLEAELFFAQHYREVTELAEGVLVDARLFGDGYDYEVTTKNGFYLAEVKGIRGTKGKLRLTRREFLQARTYRERYILAVVGNLEQNPSLRVFVNPLEKLSFGEVTRTPKPVREYHLTHDIIW